MGKRLVIKEDIGKVGWIVLTVPAGTVKTLRHIDLSDLSDRRQPLPARRRLQWPDL